MIPIMQPAIPLPPSHFLQNIGTSITIRLSLFLSVPARLPERYCFCTALRRCTLRISAEIPNVHRFLFGSVQVIQESPVIIQCFTTGYCNIHFNSLFTNHTVTGVYTASKKITYKKPLINNIYHKVSFKTSTNALF